MYFDVDTASLTCASVRGAKVIFPATSYSETIMLPFESMMVPAPVGYVDILRAWYGNDYMTPKRIGGEHDYPIFGKAEQLLKQYYKQNNQEFPEEFI